MFRRLDYVEQASTFVVVLALGAHGAFASKKIYLCSFVLIHTFAIVLQVF